jgi:hypothetical protein
MDFHSEVIRGKIGLMGQPAPVGLPLAAIGLDEVEALRAS